jgi:hypothetical protein
MSAHLTMDDHMLVAAPDVNTIDETDMLAALIQDLRLAEARTRALERDLANREVDIRALEARAAYGEAWIAHLEHRALVAEQRGDELHERILAIYRSTSWRLTGPMRRLIRLVRR